MFFLIQFRFDISRFEKHAQIVCKIFAFFLCKIRERIISQTIDINSVILYYTGFERTFNRIARKIKSAFVVAACVKQHSRIRKAQLR